MKSDSATFIFASWSVYDQIAKRRIEVLRSKGKFSDAKIVDAKEPQDVLDLDQG